MVKRLIWIPVLLFAVWQIAAAGEKKYFEFPSTGQLKKADRILVYQDGESRNITGAALYSIMSTPAGLTFEALSGYARKSALAAYSTALHTHRLETLQAHGGIGQMLSSHESAAAPHSGHAVLRGKGVFDHMSIVNPSSSYINTIEGGVRIKGSLSVNPGSIYGAVMSGAYWDITEVRLQGGAVRKPMSGVFAHTTSVSGGNPHQTTYENLINKPTIPVACGTDPATAIFDGAPGAPALFCNLSGGVRSHAYDASGTNPYPAPAAFVVQLWEAGRRVVAQAWQWWTGGASNRIYGTGTGSSFTPSLKPTYSDYSGNNYLAVQVKYSSLYGRRYCITGAPIAITKAGQTGATGATGATGPTVQFAVGVVTTLTPGTPAYVNYTGSGLLKTVNYGIPKGADGDPGAITQAQIFDKIDDPSTGILARRTNNADSDVMFKIMDLAGNTRLFATAAGLLVVMDANGKYRFVYDSANQRLKLGNYSASSTRANIIIDSSGMITGYKRSGRTVAYTLHSSLVIR